MYSDTAGNMEPNIPNELGAEAKHYLQAISRGLHCSRTRKAHFMNQMHESILRYLSEKPDATLADLTAEFGTPDEIAKSFLEEADPVVMGKSLRFGRKIFWAVLAVAIIAAVVISSMLFLDFADNRDYRDGFYVETVGESASSFPEIEINSIGVY